MDQRGRDTDKEEEWIPIAEGGSADSVKMASRTLSEKRVPFTWAHPSTEVDEMRRVLEDGIGGQLLLVRPGDAEQAFSVAGDWLVPIQNWSDVRAYLESRPTDDVLKILDLGEMWPEASRDHAREVLLERGVNYPPTAVSSTVMPFLGMILTICFGPLGLVFHVRIDQKDQMPSGGVRLHYDEATRKRAHCFLIYGLLCWVLVVCLSVAAKVLKD